MPLSGTTRGHERLWQHAEEFLEQLDSATQGNRIHIATFRRLINTETFQENHSLTNLHHLRQRALVALAAECSLFVEGARPLEQERWDPYLHWATKTVTPQDTIITFNYDRVLDLLEAVSYDHADSSPAATD